jgi:hypothetical protein
MAAGASTNPNFRIRVITDHAPAGPGMGTWVLRDEYDDDGNLLGTQQLFDDGWWGECHEPDSGGAVWNGEPMCPTHLSHGPYGITPGAIATAPGSIYTSGTTTTVPSTSGGILSTVTAAPAPSGSLHTDADGRIWVADGKGNWRHGAVESTEPPKGGPGTLTPEAIESMVKAVEKANALTGSTLTVNPHAKKLIDAAAAAEEEAFIHGTDDKRIKKKPPKTRRLLS